jgi:hypothetical protein
MRWRCGWRVCAEAPRRAVALSRPTASRRIVLPYRARSPVVPPRKALHLAGRLRALLALLLSREVQPKRLGPNA